MITQSQGHIGNGLFLFDCPLHGRISCLLHPMDRHMLRIEGDLATTSVLRDMKKKKKALPPPVSGTSVLWRSQGRFESSCSAIWDTSVFHREKSLEAVFRAVESYLTGRGRPA
jgi:hypothetical protein